VAEILSLVWGIPANFNGFASWQRYCTASSSGRQPNFRGVEQRALPMFGRATITLGIGQHSSCDSATCYIMHFPAHSKQLQLYDSVHLSLVL